MTFGVFGRTFGAFDRVSEAAQIPILKAAATGSAFAVGLSVPAGATQKLTCPRGAQIAGNYYSNIDTNQGWITLWVKPTWAGDDGKVHTLLQWSANGYLKKTAGNLLEFSVASSVAVTVDISAWSAGTFYRVDARWDADNPIDGSNNHLGLSVDDSHAFARTTDYTAETPVAIYIGADSSGANAADAIIAGLTIYRRPGWDGAAGVNFGRGDELALTTDKTAATGSWDVVFCLPTNAATGDLSLAAEAWSHAASLNLITPVNGYMLHETAWTGWNDEGTPINGAALAEAEKIYAGGYKIESNAANEGKYIDVTVDSDDNWIIRVVAHSDGTSAPKVILYDQTNDKEIGSLTGTNTSTRAAPDVLVFTGQANGARVAYGNMQFTAAPANGDTVTVGDKVYTWKTDPASPAPGADDVFLGISGVTHSAYRLLYALDGQWSDNSQPTILQYGANRAAAHPTTAGNWWPEPVGPKARTAGTAGNDIVFTTTSANLLIDAGGKLTDGSDDTNQTTLRVKLVNTAASGVTYWHQIELLANTISNPSAEHGNGNPWHPRGCSDNTAITAGSAERSTDAHSGTYARKTAAGGHCFFSAANPAGSWVSGGCWTKVLEAGGKGFWIASPALYHSLNNGTANSGLYGTINETTSWALGMGVCRVVTYIAGYTGAAFYTSTAAVVADDGYVFLLTKLTLNLE